MRGIRDFNFPQFNAAAANLRRQGYEVFNPAEHDERKHGRGFQKSETGNLADLAHTKFDLRVTLKEDLTWIADHADYVVALPGWEGSKGATAEVALARAIGVSVINYSDCAQTPEVTLVPVLPAGEVRITDATTGGQKGVKLERFDLIPAEPLEELARVYGRGSVKYSPNNWAKGYKWSLSFGAMMRHAWLFWKGEECDELGNPHMACVAWHAMTLLWFSKHRKDHDDRLTEKGPAQ
jgi:hypothetical protein